MSTKIPKIIHFCWFGGNPLPELAQRCIESWKKFCPDYKIIEWNESNFDINCCSYIKEAYEAKKWAFVSDYARFKILFEHGGVYLDTDVELLKSIDDVVNVGNYMGCENYTTDIMCVNPGLGCAAVAGHPLYAEIILDYEKSHFKNEDGTLNLYTVVQRTTEFLQKYGLKNTMATQKVQDITIYPAEYFCPKDMRSGKLKITSESYSIHHYTASWYNKKTLFYSKIVRMIYRVFGTRGFNFIKKRLGKGRKKDKKINSNS